jgi:hypothetical protein
MATRKKSRGVTLATLRRLALALPGAEEGTSYGSPAWKVRGKLFARLHQSGEDVVVKLDFDERDFLMQAKPKVFHITDHYADVEMMLVRLDAASEDELRERLEVSWRRSASKRLIADLDEKSWVD